MVEEKYLLWLSLLQKISNIKKFKLLQNFKSAENIFCATNIQLNCIDYLNKGEISSLLKHKKFDLNNYINNLKKNNIKFYSFFSESYPKKLRDIDTPPFLVYVKGNEVYNEAPVISIIGSRRCTEYGKRVAFQLAKEFGEMGIVVLSGMAYGIDTFSHKGIIDNIGHTIAVLGNSIDVCYPKENKKLKDNIENKGCTISEYSVTTEPISYNFPIRNRIIAGMCDGLIVVESGLRSGTSITVGNALDFGKDVFAVPGNIYSKASAGTNQLIKDGAIPITSAIDVVNYLNLPVNKRNNEIKKEQQLKVSLTSDEKLILSFITENPIEVETIIIKSGFEINKVQANLTMLELKFLITRLPGQRYIKKY